MQRGVFPVAGWRRKLGQQVLYKSDRRWLARCVDGCQQSAHSMFAAVWQAQRYPHRLESGGDRNADCGVAWTAATVGKRYRAVRVCHKVCLGKIGVAISPAQAGRVWAAVEAKDGAVFRSDDYGETWVRLSEQSLLRTRPWYYMHITADTQDPETVYVQNYSFWKSIDGGASFEAIPIPHGDDHALWIDPNNNRRIIDGNDGGACVSFNGGMSWSSIYNQPTAQLYHVCTDDQFPYRVYGSQQDNTAITVPSATVRWRDTRTELVRPGRRRKRLYRYQARRSGLCGRLRTGGSARLQRHHVALQSSHRSGLE